MHMPHSSLRSRRRGRGRDTAAAQVAVSRRAWTLMAAFLAPLVLATVLGLVLLWPGAEVRGGSPADTLWDPAATAAGSGFVAGTVMALDLGECPDADTAGCSAATFREGDSAGSGGAPREGSLYVPPEAMRAGLAPGDPIKAFSLDVANPGAPAGTESSVAAEAAAAPGAADYVFTDFDRNLPIGVLAVVYALVVALVAGLKGVRALLGLVFAFTVMLGFMLPALLDGGSAVLVGCVASAVIMFVVLYAAHGFSARTTTALLGTFGGIAVTGVLGLWWSEWSRLSGVYTEESYLLYSNGVSTADLVVCGILVAGLGVLNDVTITQAAAVWELRSSNPRAGRLAVFRSAMRIGRDHIASTVYTIAFAFVGGALMTLLLVVSSSRGFLESLTLGDLAIQVVNILVTSIGLVLAIPLTTGIAALVAVPARPEAAPGPE